MADRPVLSEDDPDSAIWRLAQILYEKMERLDPSYDGASWDDLSDLERDLFYFSIDSVLLERHDVLRAMKIDITRNDMVAGRFRG